MRAIEPVVLAPPEVDETRMRRDRLRRTQQLLREHQLPAALLCDPLNVRYATVEGPFPVFNLHSTFRWALVPAESRAGALGVPAVAAHHRGSLGRRPAPRDGLDVLRLRLAATSPPPPASPPRWSPSSRRAAWQASRSAWTGSRPADTWRWPGPAYA